jgi:hypothetical protein
MPNLPIHLQPGSYLAKNEPYTLRHPWPDDCMVAWGRQSIENGQPKPADRWAFFEVKLREQQTFFTRDGDNFADAECMVRRRAASEKSGDGLVCANVSGLFVSRCSGHMMECAALPSRLV